MCETFSQLAGSFTMFLALLDLSVYFISAPALSQLLSPLFRVKHLQSVLDSGTPFFSLPYWLMCNQKGCFSSLHMQSYEKLCSHMKKNLTTLAKILE